MYTGTLDEEVLMQYRDGDGAGGGGEEGLELFRSQRQLWCENIIKGVSDVVEGGRLYLKNERHGVEYSFDG